MTDINIEVTRNHYLVTAQGHAGREDVCAGISALTQMLAGCLMNHDHVKVKQFKLNDGDVTLEFTADGWKVLEDVKAMAIGLLQIQQGYPDNIKVKENIF